MTSEKSIITKAYNNIINYFEKFTSNENKPEVLYALNLTKIAFFLALIFIVFKREIKNFYNTLNISL